MRLLSSSSVIQVHIWKWIPLRGILEAGGKNTEVFPCPSFIPQLAMTRNIQLYIAACSHWALYLRFLTLATHYNHQGSFLKTNGCVPALVVLIQMIWAGTQATIVFKRSPEMMIVMNSSGWEPLLTSWTVPDCSHFYESEFYVHLRGKWLRGDISLVHELLLPVTYIFFIIDLDMPWLISKVKKAQIPF